jgi:hypothetical protein
MARFRAILTAVAKASGRNSKSLRAASNNNIFYAGVTMAAMLDPPALVFFLTVMALVLFLPSSGDPMTAVPPERLELWPLTAWERRALRLATPLLNPLTWLLLAGLLWKRVTFGLWAFVTAFFFTGFFGSSVLQAPRVWAPLVPAGRLTWLVRKNLREFLTALDLYCALLIAIPALYLRLTGELPKDAHDPLTMLMIVMPSTMALTLFGLEGEAGMARYRLLPIRGWQVLAAKGAAYLLLVLLVTAPLSPAGGLAGGLVSLATGHWVSIRQKMPQARWRFRASAPFSHSLTQMVSSLIAFGFVTRLSLLWLAPCVTGYAISLWLCGRLMDSRDALHRSM